ncbi:photosystem II reaction center protein PsbN [Calothrix sp. NIES-3974]|nr:photosystem II reaction center protein PsbN [Calothrix sp. NIES-3974]BAZ07718.1 photosystem II PsbN protein [Calothrix sp. NIES-3974]
MEPAVVLTISVGAVVVAITAMSLYTSFGPPSKQLDDPFDDHDD